jgi:16S rRNA (adenine1518-N6/adenine1519-N6)-dimethyltransferase
MARASQAMHPGSSWRRTTVRVADELESAGVRASKSRGQNFLVQPAIADRIVAAAEIAPGDEVVEIGPGLGVLSDRILRADVRRLWLVEIDPRLASRLESAFSSHPAVRVICADFLQVELARLAERPPLKVIGNLPFNAASAMLRKLDEGRAAVERMVLMFQREVSERIRARPGDRAYSALSVFTALYWEIREHFRVAAGNFRPMPRVDAEVIVFSPHQTAIFDSARESALLEVIRAAFSAPRKTIRNSLAGALDAPAQAIADALNRAAIDPAARPGTFGVADFVRLAEVLQVMNYQPRRTRGSSDA